MDMAKYLKLQDDIDNSITYTMIGRQKKKKHINIYDQGQPTITGPTQKPISIDDRSGLKNLGIAFPDDTASINRYNVTFAGSNGVSNSKILMVYKKSVNNVLHAYYYVYNTTTKTWTLWYDDYNDSTLKNTVGSGYTKLGYNDCVLKGFGDSKIIVPFMQEVNGVMYSSVYQRDINYIYLKIRTVAINNDGTLTARNEFSLVHRENSDGGNIYSILPTVNANYTNIHAEGTMITFGLTAYIATAASTTASRASSHDGIATLKVSSSTRDYLYSNFSSKLAFAYIDEGPSGDTSYQYGYGYLPCNNTAIIKDRNTPSTSLTLQLWNLTSFSYTVLFANKTKFDNEDISFSSNIRSLCYGGALYKQRVLYDDTYLGNKVYFLAPSTTSTNGLYTNAIQSINISNGEYCIENNIDGFGITEMFKIGNEFYGLYDFNNDYKYFPRIMGIFNDCMFIPDKFNSRGTYPNYNKCMIDDKKVLLFYTEKANMCLQYTGKCPNVIYVYDYDTQTAEYKSYFITETNKENSYRYIVNNTIYFAYSQGFIYLNINDLIYTGINDVTNKTIDLPSTIDYTRCYVYNNILYFPYSNKNIGYIKNNILYNINIDESKSFSRIFASSGSIYVQYNTNLYKLDTNENEAELISEECTINSLFDIIDDIAIPAGSYNNATKNFLNLIKEDKSYAFPSPINGSYITGYTFIKFNNKYYLINNQFNICEFVNEATEKNVIDLNQNVLVFAE